MEIHIDDKMLRASIVSALFVTDKHACTPSRTRKPRSSRGRREAARRSKKQKKNIARKAGKKQQEVCEKQREEKEDADYTSVVS